MSRVAYLDGGSIVVDELVKGIASSRGPAPVVADIAVSSRSQLVAALSDIANSGKTIAVTANITGAPLTITTAFTEQTRVVAQPNNMTLNMVPILFNQAAHITIEGFQITENDAGYAFVIHNADAGSPHIHLKHNWVHDFYGNCLFTGGGIVDGEYITNEGFVFSGNLVENMNYDNEATFPTGYGIYNDSHMPNATITYNTFCSPGPLNSADGMQMGGLSNSLIANNEFLDLTFDGIGPDPHADALMLWAGCHDIVVRNNRFIHFQSILFSPDTTDTLFENNLIIQAAGRAIDAAVSGTSGDVCPLRWTLRRNTILYSGYESIVASGSTIGRGDCVADRNLINRISSDPAIWSSQDNHNILTNGLKEGWPGATNLTSFVPDFYDTVDYLPKNLPSGYTDVGYRHVPAGYRNYIDPHR